MKRHSQPPERPLGVPTSVTSSFLVTKTSSRSTAVPSQVEKQVSVSEPEVYVDLSELMQSSLENTGSPDAASLTIHLGKWRETLPGSALPRLSLMNSAIQVLSLGSQTHCLRLLRLLPTLWDEDKATLRLPWGLHGLAHAKHGARFPFRFQLSVHLCYYHHCSHHRPTQSQAPKE